MEVIFGILAVVIGGYIISNKMKALVRNDDDGALTYDNSKDEVEYRWGEVREESETIDERFMSEIKNDYKAVGAQSHDIVENDVHKSHLLDDFDPVKAIVYSEIMRPKYLDK